MDDCRLLIFVRSPKPGKVKTRLAKEMGAEAACDLYRCFVTDTLALARETLVQTVLFYDPPESPMTDPLFGGCCCIPQEGTDLGTRMATAVGKILADGARQVVLMGSDIPDLPAAVIHEAFAQLSVFDAVIGPALDGGYYLIGFTSSSFDGFPVEGITWGGPDVFADTLRILLGRGKKIHVLPTWRDLDTFEDLTAFFEKHRHTKEGLLSTVDFLRSREGI